MPMFVLCSMFLCIMLKYDLSACFELVNLGPPQGMHFSWNIFFEDVGDFELPEIWRVAMGVGCILN